MGDVVSWADIRAASCLLPLSDAYISLWICGGKGHKCQLACTPLIFCNVKYFVLWMCQFSPCGHKDFCQETSFFAVLSPLFLWFRLLIHFSSVRSSSEHEYLVFTIGQRTEPRNPSYVYLNDGGQEFLCFFSAGNYIYGYLFLFFFFFFIPLVMWLYEIPAFSTVTDFRGFSIVCKLLLIYNFLSKTWFSP